MKQNIPNPQLSSLDDLAALHNIKYQDWQDRWSNFGKNPEQHIVTQMEIEGEF